MGAQRGGRICFTGHEHRSRNGEHGAGCRLCLGKASPKLAPNQDFTGGLHFQDQAGVHVAESVKTEHGLFDRPAGDALAKAHTGNSGFIVIDESLCLRSIPSQIRHSACTRLIPLALPIRHSAACRGLTSMMYKRSSLTATGC